MDFENVIFTFQKYGLKLNLRDVVFIYIKYNETKHEYNNWDLKINLKYKFKNMTNIAIDF